MHPTVNIAVRAARAAGDVILRYHNQVDILTIENKSINDFVSEVDKTAEKAIINDYLHGFPQYAVSIALLEKGVTTHAVIYDPFKEELFTASKGEGAYLNNERIRVTISKGLEDTLIGTGFPFKNPQHLDCYLDTFKAILPHVSDIRRAGAAALDLAYVAAGRLDGFWEIGLNSWDMAAGALLVKEAGGFIGDFSGRDKYMETGNVVAGNADAYKEILKKIHPHLTSDLQR